MVAGSSSRSRSCEGCVLSCSTRTSSYCCQAVTSELVEIRPPLSQFNLYSISYSRAVLLTTDPSWSFSSSSSPPPPSLPPVAGWLALFSALFSPFSALGSPWQSFFSVNISILSAAIGREEQATNGGGGVARWIRFRECWTQSPTPHQQQ